MSTGLLSLFKKMIYRDLDVRAFVVSRLSPMQIMQKVFIRIGKTETDISERHCMICLDPFCIAVWLSPEQAGATDLSNTTVLFKHGNKIRSRLELSLIEKTTEAGDILLLYEVRKAKCFQLDPLSRFITLFAFLKNKTSSFRERKYIAALYAYPRKIIAVSYKDENYCNIFPMDIQGHIAGSNLYLLGLRTTNIVLEKILATKRLVIADTCNTDIKTIYSLGRHQSIAPPPIEQMPFATNKSEVYGFPVPGFSETYMELEIIRHRKMGYHMLLVARIINSKQTLKDPPSLYHLHIMDFLHSGYDECSNVIYS